MEEHYIVTAEWCVDGDEGSEVVGVYHSLPIAQTAFKLRVNESERKEAEELGYEVFEDTPMLFDAGIDGFYGTDHMTVQIIRA